VLAAKKLRANCANARSGIRLIEDVAAVAGELLGSGSVLGNFQQPTFWNCGRISEKKVRETDGSQMGQAGEGLFILVSAKIVNQKKGFASI
jgi:hypothetical protein